MRPRAMGAMWLRDRAATLRTAANAADEAYSGGALADACRFVAARYRKAAAVLDDAATELERGDDMRDAP